MSGETCELFREAEGVCGRPAVGRFLPGYRCAEDAPGQPLNPPGWPTELRARPAVPYGTATTDPLGRDYPTLDHIGIPRYSCHLCPTAHKPKGHDLPHE